MPLYEYECDLCGHRFELIQKFSDAPVDQCPSCGGPVHKLQSAPAIQFKGAGFYITDYAKKEHTAAAKADSGSHETTAGGREGQEGSKDKTAKSVTSDKSSAASESAPSSPSTSSTSTKDSSGR